MKDIIDFTMGELTTALDGEVMKAVQRVGINVNKEELIQALELSRSIVRCQDCKFWVGHDGNEDFWCECRWRDDESPNPDDFCSYGEREGE